MRTHLSTLSANRASALSELAGLIACMPTLAARIKEAMGKKTQAELARDAKVTTAAVTFWLDGTTKSLKAEKAALLEAATGYRAAWIVTGKGPKKVAPEAETGQPTLFDMLTEDEAALLADFRAMMDEDQEEIRGEIGKRAERIRAHMRKVSQDKNLPLVAEQANARRPRPDSTSMKITPALKQQSLLDER